MIVVVVGPLLVGTMVWLLRRFIRTVSAAWRASAHDGALTVVMLATDRIPDDAIGWAAAMRAEFGSIDDRGARWRFAMGCVRVACLPNSRAIVSRVVVAGAVVACTTLEIYGRAQFPSQSAGYTALFAGFMLVGVWTALGGVPGAETGGALARRYGTTGGVAVGIVLVAAVTPLAIGAYAVPFAVAVAMATAVGAVSASGDPRTGLRTGLWIALFGGLVFFIGLMTLTFAAAGWFTHDTEAVSVFNNFGPVTQHGHQLSQWPGFAAFLARRESAVAVLVGFIGVPLIAIVSGTVGAILGGHRRQRTPSPARSGAPLPH